MGLSPPDELRFENLVEVELVTDSVGYPFTRVATDHECHVELLDTVRPSPDRLYELFWVVGVDAEAAIETVRDFGAVTDACILSEVDRESVVSLEVVGDCPIDTVEAMEGIVGSVEASPEGGRLTVLLSPAHDVRAVVDRLQRAHESLQVVARRNCEYPVPLLVSGGTQSVLREELTGRQWEALELAFSEGYFERPRTVSQEDLAATMGITQSTFRQHLLDAQRKALALLLEE